VRVIAVARNTFREAVRDKVLYVLLFFSASAILASKALGWISIGQDIKIVKDFTLGASSVFGALIAIFVGTSLLYKEIDKRTLYTPNDALRMVDHLIESNGDGGFVSGHHITRCIPAPDHIDPCGIHNFGHGVIVGGQHRYLFTLLLHLQKGLDGDSFVLFFSYGHTLI